MRSGSEALLNLQNRKGDSPSATVTIASPGVTPLVRLMIYSKEYLYKISYLTAINNGNLNIK